MRRIWRYAKHHGFSLRTILRDVRIRVDLVDEDALNIDPAYIRYSNVCAKFGVEA